MHIVKAVIHDAGQGRTPAGAPVDASVQSVVVAPAAQVTLADEKRPAPPPAVAPEEAPTTAPRSRRAPQ